jgi:Tfp pilus assembly protein PilV
MKKSRFHTGGFLLLEIIIAIMLLTGGVLALGRCMNNCLGVQEIIGQEQRARLALENAMVEIQASPALPDDNKITQLEGRFQGLTLTQRRKTLNLQNEENNAMPNLSEITLSVAWRSADGAPHSRQVAFDLLRGNT